MQMPRSNREWKAVELAKEKTRETNEDYYVVYDDIYMNYVVVDVFELETYYFGQAPIHAGADWL